MILGTGIDLCEVPRMQDKVGAAAANFVAQVFLPAEIAYCEAKRHPAEHFAARFAAKEAVVKALADAGGKGSFWLDIEISNEQDGRPGPSFCTAGAWRWRTALGVRRVLVSHDPHPGDGRRHGGPGGLRSIQSASHRSDDEQYTEIRRGASGLRLGPGGKGTRLPATGDNINIGWYCTDRICEMGLADKPALIWEDFKGDKRTYTFDDMRVLTDTFAAWLQDLGVKPGERVCLFMDRLPELYFGVLGVLKMGGIAQPLFSRLRRGLPLDPAGQRGHLGGHHPAQARQEGAQDRRPPARTETRGRGGRRRVQRSRSREVAPGPARPAAGHAISWCIRPPRNRPRSCTTPPAPRGSPRAPSTCTTR